jgi:hypothetical protein
MSASDPTMVAELSVDEFKQLIGEAVERKLLEVLGDPDEGLELHTEIQARLRRTLEAERRGTKGVPAREAADRLGLEW